MRFAVVAALAGCGTSVAPVTAPPLPRVTRVSGVEHLAPIWHTATRDDYALLDRTLYMVDDRDEVMLHVFDPVREAARHVVLDGGHRVQFSGFAITPERMLLALHQNVALPAPPGVRPPIEVTGILRMFAQDDLAHRRVEPLWQVVEPHAEFSGPVLAGDVALMLRHDEHGMRIVARAMADGAPRWTFDPALADWHPVLYPAGVAIGTVITPVVAGGAVVRHDVGALVALGFNTATGARTWTFTSTTTGYRMHAADADRLVLVDDDLVVIDIRSGAITRIPLPATFDRDQARVALDRSMAYLADTAVILTVDVSTRVVRELARGAISPGTDLALADDALYIQSPGGTIRALDRRSGALLWDWSVDGDVFLAAAHDILYSIGYDHGITAYAPRKTPIEPHERAVLHGRIDGPCSAALTIHAGDATATTRADGTYDLAVSARGRLGIWLDDAGDPLRHPHTSIRLDGRRLYTVANLAARCP